MSLENLRRVRQLANQADARNLDQVFTAVYKRLGNVSLTSSALLTATTTTKIKSNADYYGFIKGILVKKAATDNLITLTTAANTTNAYFNIVMFTIDSSGTITNRYGTQATTLAAVGLPLMPSDEAIFGAVIINPTGTGDFVGGTTAMADATVIPGAVYLNPLSALSFSAIANL